MYRRLVDLFYGYLVVIVRGKRLEQFLNRAVAEGIYLWDIKRPAPDGILLKVRVGKFALFRSCLRQSGCRGKILHRAGLPFLTRRLLHNKGLLVGLAFFMLALHVAASFIWFVAVDGGKAAETAQIRNELKELGLYPGVRRGRIEKERDRLLRELAVRFPKAAWITMELRGVVARVTMVERTPPPAAKTVPADLIAAKEGLVGEVIVFAGTPVVKKGDMVSRGDLLILGEKVLPRLEGGVERQPARAAGIVKARVWYEVKIEEPLEVWSAVRGPGKKVVLLLRYKDRVLPLHHRGEISGTNYLERHRKTIYRGRNQVSLVELIKDVYMEVSWVKTSISPGEALAKVRREAAGELSFLLPSEVELKDRREEWEISGDFLSYRLLVETLEDIAQPAGSLQEGCRRRQGGEKSGIEPNRPDPGG